MINNTILQPNNIITIDLDIKMSNKLVIDMTRLNEDTLWFMMKYPRLAAS